MDRIPHWPFAVVGGALALAIIVTVTVQHGILQQRLFPSHDIGSFNCLPSSFPAYPNMTIASARYEFGNPAPDDTKSCTMTLNSYDHFSTVSTFYRQAMNSGEWTTTSLVEQTNVSLDLGFALKTRAATHGGVRISNQGISTQVMASLFT